MSGKVKTGMEEQLVMGAGPRDGSQAPPDVGSLEIPSNILISTGHSDSCHPLHKVSMLHAMAHIIIIRDAGKKPGVGPKISFGGSSRHQCGHQVFTPFKENHPRNLCSLLSCCIWAPCYRMTMPRKATSLQNQGDGPPDSPSMGVGVLHVRS